MTEWFYVKNDLKTREDIKDIIMHPIWQLFGLQRPKVEMDEAAEECQRAFGAVCSFIGTRDLMQEQIAFRVWPLADKWEMPKETIREPDEGGLVRLKYTFKYGDKFVEPDDDWLKSIEAISDELLGSYSKAISDELLQRLPLSAFAGQLDEPSFPSSVGPVDGSSPSFGFLDPSRPPEALGWWPASSGFGPP
jgi:hypothetical protein